MYSCNNKTANITLMLYSKFTLETRGCSIIAEILNVLFKTQAALPHKDIPENKGRSINNSRFLNINFPTLDMSAIKFASQLSAKSDVCIFYILVPNVSGNKQSPNKVLANSPDPRQRSDADSEVIARHW